MGKTIFSGIIGGIIVFIWSFISWSILDWHNWAFQSFDNQESVSWVIRENTKKDGVYIIPYSTEEKGALTQRTDRRPFVLVQIKQKGVDFTHSKHYIISFLTQFVGATLISFLLLKVAKSSYWERLLFVTLIGVTIGILGYVPNWNWFGGDLLFLTLTLADLCISWFLAGLVMAMVVKPDFQKKLMV